MNQELDPIGRSVEANGLLHHVLEWSATGTAGPVFLLHGYMDAAGTWDRVAPALARAGHRVIAPDLRGFGDGPRAPRGSYYHFADYVADVAAIVEALAPDRPVSLVGHSMGGTVATLYAGAFPERVAALANLEGLGPPDNPFEVGPVRMRRWIEDLRATTARPERDLPIEQARRRLAANHPGVPPDVLEGRLAWLVRDAGGEGATRRVAWRYDPLHRTTSPVPFFGALFAAFAREVACPVLFVSGGATGFHVPDEDARLDAFPDVVERAVLEGAGHMMHWTRPAELAERLVAFLDATARSRSTSRDPR